MQRNTTTVPSAYLAQDLGTKIIDFAAAEELTALNKN
jgi:hypothetical protein